MRTGSLLGVMAMLVACQPAKDVSVDHAWVRLAAVPGNPSAAYFTLHGGPQDATLTAVAAPDAQRAEMHESMSGTAGPSTGSGGGMMSMQPLKLVALRAGDTVAFQPGGRHVMLYGLNPAALANGTTPLTLTFGNGKALTVKAKVVGAGDPEPAR